VSGRASPREVPDCVFPTDNDLEIPLLRLDMQADFLDAPVLQWGSCRGRHQINRGTWHGYSEDRVLEGIWRNPALVVATECRTCVEPNFSVFDLFPIPVVVWATYRKRWIARYWQERGVRVLVDLNVAERYMGMNLRGVPTGWRAYATHGYCDRLGDLEREHDVACQHRGSRDLLFVVYGGGASVLSVCRKNGWHHVQESRTVARERTTQHEEYADDA